MGNRLRGDSCRLRLKKSLRFPSISSRCLFKVSFLLIKCVKTLMTLVFTNFSCQSSFSSRDEGISSGGNLGFCTGVSHARAQHWNSNLSFLPAEPLRQMLSQNWLLNFAPCRWRWTHQGLKCCPRCTSLAHNLWRFLSSVVLPRLTSWSCAMLC